MPGIYVKSVRLTTGDSTEFELRQLGGTQPSQWARTASVMIQSLLLTALISGQEIELELVHGTNTIKRVLPLAYRRGIPIDPTPGGYRLSRIATQRMPDGRDEHLEAFLEQANVAGDKAYNVYDQLQVQFLSAVFAAYPEWIDPTYYSLKVAVEGEAIATLALATRV